MINKFLFLNLIWFALVVCKGGNSIPVVYSCANEVGEGTFNLLTAVEHLSKGNVTYVWYNDRNLTDLITNPGQYSSSERDVYAVVQGDSSYEVVQLRFREMQTQDAYQKVCGDSVGLFDLTQSIGTLTYKSKDYSVNFFTDKALNNEILLSNAYSSKEDIVYAQIQFGGCTDISEIQLEVGSLLAQSDSLIMCGDNTDSSSFNLREAEHVVRSGNDAVEVIFYLDSNGLMPIINSAAFKASDSVIYAQTMIADKCSSSIVPIYLVIDSLDLSGTSILDCSGNEDQTVWNLESYSNEVAQGTNNAIVWYSNANYTDTIKDVGYYVSGEGSLYVEVCSQRAEVTLKVGDAYSNPVEVIDTAVLLEKAEEVVFEVEEGNGQTYLWQSGRNFEDPTDPSSLYIANNSESLVLNSVDEDGCFTKDTIEVYVYDAKDSLEVFPELFSPNGDGVNDMVRIELEGLCALSIRIYSRFGQLVFQGDLEHRIWDGIYNNVPLEGGDYVYEVVAQFCGEEGSRVYRDKILLVR